MNTYFDSTMLSALISIAVTVITTIVMDKIATIKLKKEKLKEQFNEILKISIEYPYLENKVFCESWDPSSLNQENYEKCIRYDNYAVLVFNHLEDVCIFYDFNETKIKSEHVDIRNWLKLHKKVWYNPLAGEIENNEGYSEDFRNFIQKLIGER
ncbi:hypothetical protein [Frederiksenia canicola]